MRMKLFKPRLFFLYSTVSDLSIDLSKNLKLSLNTKVIPVLSTFTDIGYTFLLFVIEL
jgi:hypothetical protein